MADGWKSIARLSLEINLKPSNLVILSLCACIIKTPGEWTQRALHAVQSINFRIIKTAQIKSTQSKRKLYQSVVTQFLYLRRVRWKTWSMNNCSSLFNSVHRIYESERSIDSVSTESKRYGCHFSFLYTKNLVALSPASRLLSFYL